VICWTRTPDGLWIPAVGREPQESWPGIGVEETVTCAYLAGTTPLGVLSNALTVTNPGDHTSEAGRHTQHEQQRERLRDVLTYGEPREGLSRPLIDDNRTGCARATGRGGQGRLCHRFYVHSQVGSASAFRISDVSCAQPWSPLTNSWQQATPRWRTGSGVMLTATAIPSIDNGRWLAIGCHSLTFIDEIGG
jgi:hypothetical protein